MPKLVASISATAFNQILSNSPSCLKSYFLLASAFAPILALALALALGLYSPLDLLLNLVQGTDGKNVPLLTCHYLTATITTTTTITRTSELPYAYNASLHIMHLSRSINIKF